MASRNQFRVLLDKSWKAFSGGYPFYEYPTYGGNLKAKEIATLSNEEIDAIVHVWDKMPRNTPEEEYKTAVRDKLSELVRW